jgi:DNA repair protein RadA
MSEVQKIVGHDLFFLNASISLIMPFNSGFSVYHRNNKLAFISSGDSTLDVLLGGGFHKNLVYLLYGDKKKTTDILLTTAVISQKSIAYGGFGEGLKIAFVDGNNRFNPYNISKFAVLQHLSPQKVLENIVIARAFTWDQMIELLENKLSTLEQVKVVLISGITSLFQSYEKQTFEDLLRAIDGIKKILEKSNPLIILTSPLNEYSLFKPKGGHILSHFGNVLVLINDDERFTEYILIQHPFLPEKRLLKWKPRKPKRNLSKSLRNTTLDCWF